MSDPHPLRLIPPPAFDLSAADPFAPRCVGNRSFAAALRSLLLPLLGLLLLAPLEPFAPFASAQMLAQPAVDSAGSGYAGPIGRVVLAEGTVTLTPSPADDPVAEPTNYPLSAGARLGTARDGRLELEFPDLLVWLAERSELRIDFSPDGAPNFEVVDGTVAIQRLSDRQPPAEFFSGPSRVELKQRGRYRIDVDRNGLTVRVSEGFARVESGVTVAYLTTGQQIESSGGQFAPPADFDLASADDFDRWLAERREGLSADDGNADRYASQDANSPIPGWRELDGYGSWKNSEEYGSVWFPGWLPAGWAPYRSGHWVWLSAWGWTWVDSAPWGFAPSHFGRWAQLRGRWCWVPGTHRRFSPAVVHFHDNAGQATTPSRRHERPRRWSPRSPAPGDAARTDSASVIITAGDELTIRSWPARRRGASLRTDIRIGSPADRSPRAAAAGDPPPAGAAPSRQRFVVLPPPENRTIRPDAGTGADDSRRFDRRPNPDGDQGRIRQRSADRDGMRPRQGRDDGEADRRRHDDRERHRRARDSGPPTAAPSPPQRVYGKELWQQWQDERQAAAEAKTPPPPVYPGMPKADRDRSGRGSGTGEEASQRWPRRGHKDDGLRGNQRRGDWTVRPSS